MTCVIVDNWTLECAADYISNDSKKQPTSEYIRLIEALILWDRVYYVESPFSSPWKLMLTSQNYSSLLTMIPTDFCLSDPLASCLLKRLQGGSSCTQIDINLAWIRTFDYQLLSNRLGMHYLPSDKRAMMLRTSNAIQETYNREDIVAYLDNSVNEFYKMLVNRLGKNKISFHFPMLFDYIRYCCDGKITFDGITQLHNSKEVKNFRTWMDTLETQIADGNLLSLKQTLDIVPEIVNDLTKLTTRAQVATLEIGLTPSLAIPISPMQIYTGIKKLNEKVHTDFFRILTNYALTKRRE